MEIESLVQPTRLLTASETAGELEGSLELPDKPQITAGYADIYHAVWVNPQGDRVEVAVKQLRGSFRSYENRTRAELERSADKCMKQEVFVWNQIKHPNLYPLLGYRSQPSPQLISLWSRHGNLADYLKSNPDLSVSDRLRLLYQAACGLDHLHSQAPPIFHAAIKPENVLINDSMEAALSDFGLSRVLEGLEALSGLAISEGLLREDYNYAAGELLNGEKPNRESDVYAFGGLILTVTSGKPPFFGLTLGRLIERVVGGQMPEPKDHPKLPASDPLWSLMRRCWNRTPAGRPVMREVLRQLRERASCEKLILSSRPGPVSSVHNEEAEDSDLILDAPGALPRGISQPLPLDPARLEEHLSSTSEFNATLELTSSGMLDTARVIFTNLQAESKDIPVTGKYIEAVAAIGLVLLEITQIVKKDEEIARSLGSYIWPLAILLEGLSKRSSSSQGFREETTTQVAGIRSELDSVREKIKNWCFLGAFMRTSSPGDRVEAMVWKVLEDIPLLANLAPQTQ